MSMRQRRQLSEYRYPDNNVQYLRHEENSASVFTSSDAALEDE